MHSYQLVSPKWLPTWHGAISAGGRDRSSRLKEISVIEGEGVAVSFITCVSKLRSLTLCRYGFL